MRFLSSRMGGDRAHPRAARHPRRRVYSFSYFVLGPVVSFVAVASIMVDYILTACISSASAADQRDGLPADRAPVPR